MILKSQVNKAKKKVKLAAQVWSSVQKDYKKCNPDEFWAKYCYMREAQDEYNKAMAKWTKQNRAMNDDDTKPEEKPKTDEAAYRQYFKTSRIMPEPFGPKKGSKFHK